MTDALALGAKLLLLPGLEPVGVLDERLELGEALPLGVGAPLELLDPTRRRGQCPPGVPRVRPPRLLRAEVGIEQVELIRQAGQSALRELPGQHEQAVGRSDDVVAGD